MNQTKVLNTLTGTWTTYPDIPAGRASGHACIKTQVDFQPDSEAGVMVTGGKDWRSAAGDLYPGRRVDFFSLKNLFKKNFFVNCRHISLFSLEEYRQL